MRSIASRTWWRRSSTRRWRTSPSTWCSARDEGRGGRDGRVTAALATDALDLLEIDDRGLDALDRQLLRAIAEHHGGGPVGLQTMAATISEPVETLEDVIEPYLMQIGLLARTA